MMARPNAQMPQQQMNNAPKGRPPIGVPIQGQQRAGPAPYGGSASRSKCAYSDITGASNTASFSGKFRRIGRRAARLDQALMLQA